MEKLEKEKIKLDKMIEYGYSQNRVLKQSQKVDKLIVKYYNEKKRLEKKYRTKL